MTKLQFNVRLSAVTRAQIDQLRVWWGETESEIVTRLTERAWQAEAPKHLRLWEGAGTGPVRYTHLMSEAFVATRVAYNDAGLPDDDYFAHPLWNDAASAAYAAALIASASPLPHSERPYGVAYDAAKAIFSQQKEPLF